MRIENPTLAHFRHFRHFSSLFTNLPAYKAADIYVPIRHYICRGPSTNQLLFMQNKPNFRKSQMNVSIFSTKAYENIANWTLGQNKPNSNPIKANFPEGKIDAKCVFTKDYRKKDDFAVRKNKPNSNPIFLRTKTNATLFTAKDYENETTHRPQKNKPNSNPISVKPKMSANLYVIEDYENETAFRLQKNKPKTNPISSKSKMSLKSLAGKSGTPGSRLIGAGLLTDLKILVLTHDIGKE